MSLLHRTSIGLVALAALASPALAAEPRPEITRAAAKPQATNVLHTVRAIPEACARLEGMFTGRMADPYKFAVVRTSANCQARARFVDAAEAKPTTQGGWVFNDLIRVPSANCPSQQAVVRVWRRPGHTTPPALDPQGRARIYLQDARKPAAASAGDIPMFAATMAVEGTPCG
jgi:hypothetical protein